MFFFFKQKTAYEMRISDWSSDVCSSDLLAEVGVVAVVSQQALHGLRNELALELGQHRMPDVEDQHHPQPVAVVPGFVADGVVEHQPIGRASRRERVCQDV